MSRRPGPFLVNPAGTEAGLWTSDAVGGGIADGPADMATRRSQPRGIVGVGPGDVHGHVYPTAATSAGVTAAVTAIGANVRTLNLQAVDFAISVPASVPAGIHAVAHAGTRFIKTGTGTLHFDSFDAPPVQVFWGFSAGQVTFGPHVKVRPEWWGAKPDSNGTHGNGTDCLLAFQCAVQSRPASDLAGATIVCGSGTYRISGMLDATITAPSGFWKAYGAYIHGSGRVATKLFFDSNVSTDGLVYSSATQYGLGGGIRDLSLVGAAGSPTVRDLLVAECWCELAATNYDAHNAGRDGQRDKGNLFCTFKHATLQGSGRRACSIGYDLDKNWINSSSNAFQVGTDKWLALTANLPAGLTVTLNSGPNPDDGALTATRVDFPSINGAWQVSELVYPTRPFVVYGASVDVTFSFWARAVSGTGTLYAGLADSGATYLAGTTSALSLTETWQRFEIPATLTRDCSGWQLIIGPDGSPFRGMPQTQAALSCYLWKPQLELGSTATAYELGIERPLGTTSNYIDVDFEQSTEKGCLIGYGQLNTRMRDCTFEGNGAHGLDHIEGLLTLDSPHFEGNGSYAAIFGSGQTLEKYASPQAHITAPLIAYGTSPSASGLRFEACVASELHGGHFFNGWVTYPLVISRKVRIGTGKDLDISGFPYPDPAVCADGISGNFANPPVNDLLVPVPIGPLQIKAVVGTESGNAIEVACTVTDSHWVPSLVERSVDIEALAVTDGQTLAAAGTPVGTLVRAYNPVAGPSRAAMTTTAAGTFSFKVSDTVAESVSVRITAAGVTPLVLLLTFV